MWRPVPAKKRSNLHHADSETVGQVIDSPAGSVWFRFPAVNRDVELVGVHSGHPPYSAIRFIKARSFKAAGQDSRSPGWQRVDPSDGTDLDSQTTTVLAPRGNQVIHDLEADLHGVVVEELMEKRADPRGSYSMAWYGRAASGSVNPSGNCIARIEVDRLRIGYGDNRASADSTRLLFGNIVPNQTPSER